MRTGRLVHVAKKNQKLRKQKKGTPFSGDLKQNKTAAMSKVGEALYGPLRVCIVCLFAVFLEHIFSYNGVQEKKNNHCRK